MEKEYMLDNEPISWKDLIKTASELDDDYNRGTIKQTSIAAGILRKHGHKVDVNPDYKRTP